MPADRRHRSVLDTNARLGRWGVGTVTIQRAEDLPAGGDLQADVCIVGSGAAGITLARQLDGSRLRVVMLEAGGLERAPATEADDFAVHYVGRPSRDDIDARGRWYGGSTNLWFGRIALPDRIDLERRPWVLHSGWPLSYDELASWFGVAASILDVPRFEMIDIERWPPNPTIETFRGAAELGVFLWADGMFMGRHARALVEASRNVRLVLDATVTELVAGETSIESLAVVGPGGRRFTVTASTFVLAAGGLENPRLMLASTERFADGVGNQHGNVGRYYLDHPRSEGTARVDLRPLTAAQVERVLLLGEKAHTAYGKVQLRVIFPEAMQREESLLNHSLHAHLATDVQMSPGYASARRLREALRRRQVPDGAGRDVAAVLRASPQLLALGVRKLIGRTRLAELIVVDQMEQEPDPESRVTLDAQRRDRFGLPRLRVDWRVGESTFRSRRRMHELVRDVLSGVGIDTFESDVLADPEASTDLLDMRHPSGTTRMSVAPRDGVVDADCRVHGLANLYIAGSSVFPTVGHFNPTLVIVALAARLADRLLATA